MNMATKVDSSCGVFPENCGGWVVKGERWWESSCEGTVGAAEAAGAAGHRDAVRKNRCSGLTSWAFSSCRGGVQGTRGVGIRRAPASIDGSFPSPHVRIQMFREIC